MQRSSYLSKKDMFIPYNQWFESTQRLSAYKRELFFLLILLILHVCAKGS